MYERERERERERKGGGRKRESIITREGKKIINLLITISVIVPFHRVALY